MKCGDLLVLESAKGMEDEDIPEGFFQRHQCLAEPVAFLSAQDGIFRGGRWGFQLQLLVGGVGVAAAALGFLQPGVFADAAQPGVQTAAALKAVDMQKSLVKGLLQQLLRLVGVAGQGE